MACREGEVYATTALIQGNTGSLTGQRMDWNFPLRPDFLPPVEGGLMMGVLNVTPDSFSDGGRHLDLEAAVAQARQMAAEGAAIIDVGGESTRPGSAPVPEDEELRRVIPVIERLISEEIRVAISIDTQKAAVASAAVQAGAHIINDVTGMRSREMRRVAAETGAGVVIMHMQGTPQSMQREPRYHDVVAEVHQFLRGQTGACVAEGIAPERMAVDPGIGFGKTLAHNLELLRNLERACPPGHPILVGISRKSFIGKLLDAEGARDLSTLEDRAWPTVALTAYLREAGAHIFRVHETAANVDALRMVNAVR